MSGLSDALNNGGELPEQPVSDAADARAIAKAIGSVDVAHLPDKNRLQSLIALLQQVDSREAFEVLAREALPRVLEIYDRGKIDDDLKLFLLKIFALYLNGESGRRIVEAARAGLQPTAFMWSVVFQALPVEHPLTAQICQELGRAIPGEFIGVALLDLANELSAKGKLSRHPFDSADGITRLQTFLYTLDQRQFSYAASAVGAAPFLKSPARSSLLHLGRHHDDANVRMRAAWAVAKLGEDGGANELAKMCLDARHSQAAWGFLAELGRQELIPIDAQRPNFRAMAEMCDWLGHRIEFGRPPDEIEMLDTRELNWTPAGDRRRVWLFKFKYVGDELQHVGMVGSITFSLGKETDAEILAEDVYGLHCCWELGRKRDRRAPAERTAAAGRKLLGI